MKNRLADLNNTLFAQLNRLNNDDLDPERIAIEAQRANAMCLVADRIIENHGTVIRVLQTAADAGMRVTETPLIEFLEEPALPPSKPKR